MKVESRSSDLSASALVLFIQKDLSRHPDTAADQLKIKTAEHWSLLDTTGVEDVLVSYFKQVREGRFICQIGIEQPKMLLQCLDILRTTLPLSPIQTEFDLKTYTNLLNFQTLTLVEEKYKMNIHRKT